MTRLLRLRLMGNPELELAGKPLSGLPSRAAQALLIYLACQKRPFSREALAELLWVERSPQQALTNLRTILSALRRELDEFLLVSRETLAFNVQADYWLDTDEFEERMAKLAPRLHSAAGRGAPPPAELQKTLELYQGDFLAGFALRDGPGFEEWAILEQERLRRLAHNGLRRLARYFLETGNYPAGIASAQKLLALDAYDEEALRLLMWHLARNGQRNAALVQYEAARRTLAQELGVEPAPETSQVYQRLRGMVYPPPNNLPPAAAFIGRENEMAEIAARLAQPTCRLISLLGAGGMGKTRLALEAARRMAEAAPGQFLDGIFFAPLETLNAPQDLELRLGETLGIPFDGSVTPRIQLLRALKEKELLLILDNFEHLLDDNGEAVTLLADLLAQAPAVKLLVTSRQRLHLVEEWIFDLSGLAIPQAGQTDPLSASAATLFLQAAQRLQRQFIPTSEDISAIVRVCQMLDGLPLAIELAAGWARQYRCTEIAAQVKASLDFLQATQRNAPERRRSLRAVFEHSWGLLDTAGQSAFARLSVLRGDFSAEAASATLANGAERTLTMLMDHSLIQRRADGRYAMHPTLRQYAAEKLALDAEIKTTTLERHSSYFLNWLTGQGDGEAADQRAAIRGEMANLRTAWEWAAQRGKAGLLESAAPVLHSFFSVESWFVEGIQAFQVALEGLSGEAVSQAPLICDLLGRRGRMQIHIGQLGAARAGLDQAYGLLNHVPQAERRAAILGYLAITHYYAGDYARAAELAGQSLRLSQDADDLAGVATALNFLGSCHKARGEYELARQHFEQSAAVYRLLPDPLGEAMVLNNLGNLAQVCGDFAAAQQNYIQGGLLFKAHHHTHGAATMLANAGHLAFRLGDFTEAKRQIEESLALKREIGDQRGIAIALSLLGEIATVKGKESQAWEQLSQALAIAHALGDIKLTLDILVGLGVWGAKTGQGAMAARLLEFVAGQETASQEARERAQKELAALQVFENNKGARQLPLKTIEELIGGILPAKQR